MPKIKEGNYIKIRYQDNKLHKVKVIEVLELFPNGNGFAKVQFNNGKIKSVSLKGVKL